MNNTMQQGYCGDGYNGTCVSPMAKMEKSLAYVFYSQPVCLIKFRTLSAIVV